MELISPLEPGWARVLDAHAAELEELGAELNRRRAAGDQVLPAREHILRAFRQPFDEVRVLILGQDPYPTPGHPIGLAFSVAADVSPLPRSLANIYRELTDDVGVPAPAHGDLTAWTRQGVLLLNRCLTVTAGAPASHRGLGWEAVTQAAVEALAARDAPLVALLWGADARRMAPALRAAGAGVVESPHPSPLSAHRGFFGSRPFSRANAWLAEHGSAPIDWSLPPA